MFGHPTRDTFDLVAPICRFLCYDTHCCVVTRDGAFTKVFKDMRIAVEVTCLSHRKINACPVKSGQSANCTIGCGIFPCKVRLCDFKDVREKGPEQGSLPRIAIGESLIPDVESSFLGFTDVQVTQVLQGNRANAE